MKNSEKFTSITALGMLITLLWTPMVQSQNLNIEEVLDQPGQMVGRVLFVKGDAHIIGKDGTRRVAKQGDGIGPGERLVTGDGTLVQVKMLDGGRIGLRAGSDLSFAEPARAIAGAPNVIELRSGDVRVLNFDVGGQKKPGEYVLKTPDGFVQLSRADSVVSLRPANGETGAPKRTLVKLTAGNAIASNTASEPRTVEVNQGVAMSTAGVKVEPAQSRAATPVVSSRLKTATDPLFSKVALATPIETARTPGAFSLEPLAPLALPAKVDGMRYVGFDVWPSLVTAASRSERVQEKLLSPVAGGVIKPLVSATAVVAVKTGQLPKVIVPPSVETLPSAFGSTSTAVNQKILTPVITGGTAKLPPTLKLPPIDTRSLKKQ